MAYRRARNYRNMNIGSNNMSNYTSDPTVIHIHWSQKSGSYSVKYGDLKHFEELKMFNLYMKTRPWGEYEYDSENKIWYLHEKHLQGLLDIIAPLGPVTDKNPNTLHHFDIDLQGKPANGNIFQSQFVPIDKYKKIFADLSGEKLDGLDYKSALRIYRQTCRQLHPDVNPNGATQMSELNEAWDVIKARIYNIKPVSQEVEFV